MKALLDTNIMLWAMSDPDRLSAAARRELARATEVFVSAASIWEVSIKVGLGKLEVDVDELVEGLSAAGFEPLPITFEHSRAVRGLPHHHRDPFDRMLIAQAFSEPLRLLTHDQLLRRYGDWVVVV